MNSTVSRGLVLLVLVTCTMLLLWWFVPKPEDRGGWHVSEVRDGATIVVERNGESHVVVITGIAAPAVGECGVEVTQEYLGSAIGGVEVVLKPDSHDPEPTPTDPKAPWSRYVEFSGRDVGLAEIEAGYAFAADGEYDRAEQYRNAESAFAGPYPFGCD